MMIVESCCCGCISLKNGTRTLLILNLIWGVLCLCVDFLEPAFEFAIIADTLFSIILVFCSITGFYAISRERSLFLIPFLGNIILWMVKTLIIMVIYPILTPDDLVIAYIPIYFFKVTAAIVLYVLSCLIFEVILFNWYRVVYSFYKELEEGNKPQSSPRAT